MWIDWFVKDGKWELYRFKCSAFNTVCLTRFANASKCREITRRQNLNKFVSVWCTTVKQELKRRTVKLVRRLSFPVAVTSGDHSNAS
jgi:hypothetical protein